ESFDIESTRVGTLLHIAGVITLSLMLDQFRNDLPGDLRINERAVRRRPDDYFRICLSCRSDESRQHILLTAPEPRRPLTPSQLDNRRIGITGSCCNHD